MFLRKIKKWNEEKNVKHFDNFSSQNLNTQQNMKEKKTH